MEFNALSKENQDRIMRLRTAVRSGTETCTERGKFLTESYKQTEAAPYSHRKAAALVHIMKNRTVKIWDDEIIVGAMTSKRLGQVLMPDVNASWMAGMVEELDKTTGDASQEVQKEDLRFIADYWSGKCLYSRWWAELPEKAKEINEVLIGGMSYAANGQNFGHFALDYARILEKGVRGILRDIDEAERKNCVDLGDPRQFDAYCLYQDMRMELNALIEYAHRYAELAESMAETERDPKRKAELLKIADVCRWVPENTPRDFQEALQAQVFVFDAIQTETFSHAGSLGRVDQIFYPYYKKDKEAGMTEEQAFLLYAAYLLKIASARQCPPLGRNASMFGQTGDQGGGGMVSTIGGTDREGNCAVNELSYLILDVERTIAFSNDLMIRINANTPNDFLVKALKLARDLSGKSKFLGDACITRQMRAFGRPEGEINNYCVVGCTAPALPSYSLDVSGGIISLPMVLDLALHDGFSTTLNKQMGPHTGDPRAFTGWEDVFEAYKKQYEFFLPYIHILSNVDKRNHGLYNPTPLASAFYPACLETGKDLYRGALGRLTSYAFSLGGGPNVGDALTALRKVVFEEKTLSMDQVLDALDNNFEGEEGERVKMLLDRAPKFGNDDDYADEMVARVMDWTSDATCAAPGEWGSTTTVAGAAVALNIALGAYVGATPDGRRAGEPLSEGGLSPCQGKNVSGATATLNSLLKMPHLKLHHGEVLNMRFDPAMLATDEKINKLAMMVRSFLLAGGYLVQFNIVSSKTLRDAQAHPEEYKDLLVRVATYSAYFVTLTKGLQDDIINRAELSL